MFQGTEKRKDFVPTFHVGKAIPSVPQPRKNILYNLRQKLREKLIDVEQK